MNAPVLLAITSVIFALAPLVLGSNAVYMMLALCAGELLAELVAKDVTQIINSTIYLDVPMFSIVQISLLIIAPLILLFMLKGSIRHAKKLLQVIPAISTAIIGFMLIVQKLPYDLQTKIKADSVYAMVKPFYGLAIAVGLFVTMFYLWTKRPKHDKLDKQHGK